MRFSIFFAIFLTACGPDVTAWKGTWTGSGTLNTGRLPEPYTGTLTIADGARFELSVPSSGTTFTCAINAATVDGTTATFTVPASCTMTATPSDGCTYQVTVNAASATRTADTIEGTANGRVNSTCTSSSSKATDFALTLFGTRK